MQKWYVDGNSESPQEYIDNLHIPSFLEIMTYLERFFHQQSIETIYEVLNAQPGHGKTTALKIFIKKMIQLKYDFSGLIVLREKAQMKDIEEFVSRNGNKNGILYIDSDNFQEVKETIPNYQFVVISHERFRNLTLDNRLTNNFGRYEKWRNLQRVIIIDEVPSFVDSAVFELGGKLDWLDDCFHAAKNVFSDEQRIRVRSIIQILIAEEFIVNKGSSTVALKEHLNNSQHYAKVLQTFFNTVDYYINEIVSVESLGMYNWFKRLFYEDNIGYIDSGIYLDNYSDHKKIICSQRIDYRQLKSSILILDGTANYTKTMYNNEYVIHSLSNYTKYERLTIYQRSINTSARQRKTKVGLPTQKLIAKDIKEIQSKGIKPIPIMNKFEIPVYLKLKAISTRDYQRYFQSDVEESKRAINILNTTGKNQLADQNSLYLTSLPNRPAIFYKEIAISLYKELEYPLDLSMNNKNKKHDYMWFADERIEKIYLECVLSELYQIIHRSSIRNLLVPASENISIFIATKFDHIIEKLLAMFNGQAKFERVQTENMSKFQERIASKISAFANKIEKENIKLPNRIGKIENGSSIKNLINQNWKDEEKKRELIEAFHHNGLDIISTKNSLGEEWKEIDRYTREI